MPAGAFLGAVPGSLYFRSQMKRLGFPGSNRFILPALSCLNWLFSGPNMAKIWLQMSLCLGTMSGPKGLADGVGPSYQMCAFTTSKVATWEMLSIATV